MNHQGNYLFIDQPLNVGFSFTKNRKGKQVSSAHEAADHLMNFLYNFYQQWPSLKASPLYLTGESFAGHYLPAFSRVLIQNETFIENMGIDFRGTAIGDGWTDPINQVNYYDSYLSSVGVIADRFRQ